MKIFKLLIFALCGFTAFLHAGSKQNPKAAKVALNKKAVVAHFVKKLHKQAPARLSKPVQKNNTSSVLSTIKNAGYALGNAIKNNAKKLIAGAAAAAAYYAHDGFKALVNSHRDKIALSLVSMYAGYKFFNNESSSSIKAFFSPDDGVQEVLVDLIEREEHSIKIAIYSFSNDKIAQALLRAHARGVAIEVVADPSQWEIKKSKIALLKAQGIPVFKYNPEYIPNIRSNLMHNKFAIFDSLGTVITGSFNFSRAANERNQENIVVIQDKVLFKKFSKQFLLLKQRCFNTVKKSNYRLITG